MEFVDFSMKYIVLNKFGCLMLSSTSVDVRVHCIADTEIIALNSKFLIKQYINWVDFN